MFYKHYIVYHNVYRDYSVVFIEQHLFSSCLVVMSIKYMPIYVLIVMYGLRLFIVVLQELHCLPSCLHVGFNRVSITSPCFIALHLLVSEIAKCIALECLLLFYKNYIVYYNVYHDYLGVFIEIHVYTKFHIDWLLHQ